MDRPDQLEVLLNAITNLQDALATLGPQVELEAIRLKPNSYGGHEFRKAVYSSPSFQQIMGPESMPGTDRPPGVLMELLGVKIIHVRT